MKKILIIVPSLTKGKGGAEKVAAALSNYLSNRYNVYVLVDDKKGAKPSYPINSKVKIVYSNIHGKTLRDFKTKVTRIKPDCAFIFYFNATILKLFPILHELGISVGVQECCAPIRAVRNISLSPRVSTVEEAFWLRQAILGQADAIRLTMQDYRSSLPYVQNEKIFVFKNTFEIADTPAMPWREALAGKRKRKIINVGGLKVGNKNGIALYDAYLPLADKYNDLELHFFGTNNFPAIAEDVSRKNLSHRVFFHGPVDDIALHYNTAYMHVICSFEEGCPNVVCEAMANGIPSIGFADCPGTNELIENDKNGLLVERDSDSNELSLAIKRLVDDPRLKNRLGKRAYTEAKNLFDHNKIYANWDSLFQTLLKKKKKSKNTKKHTEEEFVEAYFRIFNETNLSKKMEPRGNGFLSYNNSTHAPLVSIIVPLYNKEQYLEETIESILRCDYLNKEIIIVDDCSTDSSLKIANTYSRKKLVTVIARKENGGLSASRNTGLAKARGKYVQFWDADDIYDKEGLGQIIKMMEEDQSDIGTGLATRDGQVIARYNTVAAPKRRVKFIYQMNVYSTNSACFKIYNKKFLADNKLTFFDQLHTEDLEFNLRAFLLSEFVSVTPYKLGEYRYVENSLGKSINEERFNSCFEMHKLVSKIRADQFQWEFALFRDIKAIQYCYVVFLRWALTALYSNSTEVSDLSNVPDNFLRNWLSKMSNVLPKYLDAIKEISATNPSQALFLILIIGNDHQNAWRVIIGNSVPRSVLVTSAMELPKPLSRRSAESLADRYLRSVNVE